MLLATMALTLLVREDCSSCRVEGREVKLCQEHVELDQSGLARESRRLASKDEAERCSGLEALAELTKAHANAPSARVAERLAGALDDPAFNVRLRAASLLGPPQHAIVSLDALLKALSGAAREVEKQGKQFDELEKKLKGKLPENKEKELKAESAECRKRCEELQRWKAALVAQLGRFPDARSVKAVLTHSSRNLLLGGEEVLVQLGSQASVRALVDSFKAAERDLKMAEKDAQLAKTQAERGPAMLNHALTIAAYERMREAHAAGRKAVYESFVARGLTPPAESAPVDMWCEWIEKVAAEFPAELPGVSSPVW